MHSPDDELEQGMNGLPAARHLPLHDCVMHAAGEEEDADDDGDEGHHREQHAGRVALL